MRCRGDNSPGSWNWPVVSCGSYDGAGTVATQGTAGVGAGQPVGAGWHGTATSGDANTAPKELGIGGGNMQASCAPLITVGVTVTITSCPSAFRPQCISTVRPTGGAMANLALLMTVTV